jgi:hopanoid biosynthesis associated RND transporter like protein HpnN
MAGGEEALTRALLETRATIDARLAGGSRPIAFSRLFADDDGAVRRILTVTPKLDYSRLQPAKPARLALDAAIAAADPAAHGVTVQVTGDPAMRSEELGSVMQGIGVSLAISLAALSGLLWFAFRNLRLSLLALSIVFIANGVAAAFASLAFDALNLVSMAFAVLLTGVGADFAIHLIMHARQPGASIHGSVQRLGVPLLLCALATVFGFLAFVPTPFRGMTQLGLIGAVGVITAFLATLVVIPAGLALIPPSRLPGGDGPGLLARLPQRPLLILGLGVLVVAAVLAPRARFETDPMALRDPAAPSVRAFSTLFADKDTRPYSASVVVADAARAEALADRLAALPEVDRVVTPDRLLPGEAAIYRRDAIDAVAYGLLPQLEGGEPPVATDNGLARLKAALAEEPRPGGAELARSLAALEAAAARDPALLAALQQDVLANWPDMLGKLRQSLSPDPEPGISDLPAALRSRYLAPDGQVRVEVVPRADLRDPAARKAFIAAVRAVAPEAAGPVMNLDASGKVVERAMLTATLTALAACGLLLLLVERSPWRTLATLAPILAACLLTLGGSVLFQIPFNYANVIALPMLIGAGIDSAIHMAWHPPDAESGDSGPTPRAIVVTALTTITSFGSLIFSDHRGVASIGALLLVALASTTFAALVLEPPLLRLASRLEARGKVRKALAT